MSAFADIFAEWCVTGQVKSADGIVNPALAPLRDEFEQEVGEEQGRRNRAERFRGLAADRARAEDTSFGGYAGTLLGRPLHPMPHSWAEAASRLIGAGVGQHLAAGRAEKHEKSVRPYADISKDDVASVIQEAGKGGGGGKGKPGGGSKGGGGGKGLYTLDSGKYQFGSLGTALSNKVRSINLGKTSPRADAYVAKLLDTMNAAKTEDVHELFRGKSTLEEMKDWSNRATGKLPSSIGSRLKFAPRVPSQASQDLRKLVGSDANVGHLADVFRGAKPKPDKGVVEKLVGSVKPKHFGARLGGAAIGQAIGGIPAAILDTLRKPWGGSGAVRARGRAMREEDGAEASIQRREDILKRIAAMQGGK